MNRGARREPIFHKDSHCIMFLEILATAARRRGVEVHAYALMPNHFHLLVRSLRGSLSRFMQDVGGDYSRRLNRVYSWDGPLFKGRFHSQLVEDDVYLRELVSYIHLNPVRAQLVKEPQEDCWTSHEAYLGLAERPEWMTFDHFLEVFGDAQTLHEEVMDHHRRTLRWPDDMDMTTGWRKARARPEASVPKQEPCPPVPALDPARVLSAAASAAGTTKERLVLRKQGRGGNPGLRFAAIALSRWTDATQRDIGARLGISSAQVAQILHRHRREPKEPVKTWLDDLENVLSENA